MEILQKWTIAEVNLNNSEIELHKVTSAPEAISLESYEVVWEKYADMMAHAVSQPAKSPFLAISTGPLTGTGVPGSAAYFVSFVSPVTGKLTTQLCEGSIGPYLRYAGIEHLFIYGKAKKPIILSIDDGGINIIPAQKIEDLDSRATTETLNRKLGENTIIASVGSFGKTAQSRFASVVYDYYHEIEALGLGRVFFDLGIKALAINGQGAIAIAQPERFLQELIEIYKYYKSTYQNSTKFGYISGDTYLSPKNENRFVELASQSFGIAGLDGQVPNLSSSELLEITQQCIKEGVSWQAVLDFIKENPTDGVTSYDDISGLLKLMANWMPQNLYEVDISTVQATGLFWHEETLPFIDATGRVVRLLSYYSGKDWNSFRLEEAGRQISSIGDDLKLGVK